MLNIFNIEKQANKRVQSLILHYVREENINQASARFVVNISTGKVCVHLYDGARYVKTLDLEEISEFFGKDYDENKINSVQGYLNKLSKEHTIELPTLNLVICETKGNVGAHLYNESKYVKRISTLDLLSQFYFNK